MCQKPAAYEVAETSCRDGLDNDCDGATDIAELRCKQPGGASCSKNVECIAECDGGKCGHVIFVTSQATNGNLGGLDGADQYCQTLAAKAGMAGRWRAILSVDNNGPKSRLPLDGSVRIYNRRGQLVADSPTHLWNDGHDLHNPVLYDETGTAHETAVWSGSERDGEPDGSDDGDRCSEWTDGSDSSSGEVGQSGSRGGEWLGTHDEFDCNRALSIYCIDSG